MHLRSCTHAHTYKVIALFHIIHSMKRWPYHTVQYYSIRFKSTMHAINPHTIINSMGGNYIVCVCLSVLLCSAIDCMVEAVSLRWLCICINYNDKVSEYCIAGQFREVLSSQFSWFCVKRSPLDGTSLSFEQNCKFSSVKFSLYAIPSLYTL